MLHELDIDSYAVVERLRVRFRAGLNLLTGETGSGKSIVVDSLALLFGARGSAEVVRAGARRARVTGIFDAPPDPAARERLAASGIEAEDDEWIVERQILATGKSRAYVNGSPATVGLLRDLAPHFGDIHGQHEQQTLLSPAMQLDMLDAFAGTGAAVEALRAVYQRWREAGAALERLQGDEQERLRRADLLRYQADEIREAELRPGEDDELDRERTRLAHMERLQRGSAEAYDLLYDSNSSVSAQLKTAAASLSSIGSYDEAFEGFAERLQDARNAVDDVALELRDHLGTLEAQPARQDAIEERLAQLEQLKRKYGSTLEEVLAFGARAEEELAALEGSEIEIERLQGELAAAATEYEAGAQALSGERRAAAARLSARAKEELRDLALARARLEIALAGLDAWGPRGADRASFLFSANSDQPPRPLGQVASGGELSRVALALKTCLEPEARPGAYCRALVFDEIDTGVGGSVADAIGRRLKQLAQGNQLLCVTHLPQIARFADAHFHVAKTETEDRTNATVDELSEAQRIDELARMLSGAEITSAALANARQLLNL